MMMNLLENDGEVTSPGRDPRWTEITRGNLRRRERERGFMWFAQYASRAPALVPCRQSLDHGRGGMRVHCGGGGPSFANRGVWGRVPRQVG